MNALVAALGLFPTIARAEPPLPEPTIVVHLDSPTTVVLERRGRRDAPWEIVCVSPCDRDAVRSGEYRIVGDAKPSDPFEFGGAAGERVVLRIEADPGDRKIAGGILVGFGAITIGSGIVALIVGAFSDLHLASFGSSCADAGNSSEVADCQKNRASHPPSAPAHTSSSTTTALGATMIGVGVASLVGGLVLRASAGYAVAQDGADPPPLDRWRRVPELPGAGWSAPKPKVESPLFVVRF